MSIQEILQSFCNYKILVAGDIILDQYAFGTVNRISPEAPIQILDLKSEEFRLGGAANVARNIVQFHTKVTLCGVVGKDLHSLEVMRLLDQDGIYKEGIFQDSGRPTTVKTRFIANGHHLLRVDREEREAISQEIASQVWNFVSTQIQEYDSIVLSDYGKGMFADGLAPQLVSFARQQKKSIFVGPKGKDWSKYKGASLLSANRSETEMICGFSLSTKEDIKKAAEKILKKLELKAILITLGSQGMYLLNHDAQSFYVEAQAREVFDVVGAGDTVLSLIALCLTRGLSWEMAMKFANAAAGIVVGKIGTSIVLPEELEKNCLF